MLVLRNFVAAEATTLIAVLAFDLNMLTLRQTNIQPDHRRMNKTQVKINTIEAQLISEQYVLNNRESLMQNYIIYQ